MRTISINAHHALQVVSCAWLRVIDVCCVASWWFSIDRREADKQLMLPGNPRGTFLIRNAAGIHRVAPQSPTFSKVREWGIYFSRTWKVFENRIGFLQVIDFGVRWSRNPWILVLHNHRYHGVKILQSIPNSPVQYSSDSFYLLQAIWLVSVQ